MSGKASVIGGGGGTAQNGRSVQAICSLFFFGGGIVSSEVPEVDSAFFQKLTSSARPIVDNGLACVGGGGGGLEKRTQARPIRRSRGNSNVSQSWAFSSFAFSTLFPGSICVAERCSGRQFLITEETKVSLRCTWLFGTCVKVGFFSDSR